MPDHDSMDLTFKALGDPTRRRILDLLKQTSGLAVNEITAHFDMSRIAVMKHLGILEAAHLVVSRKEGRRRLFHLNAVPIQLIQDRWMSAYSARWASGLTALKHHLETVEEPMQPRLVYQVFIRTTPEQLWRAITDPAWTRRYFHGLAVECDWKAGSALRHRFADGSQALDGEVIEVDPPRRLVTTFRMVHNPQTVGDAATKVTWEIEPRGPLCKLTLVHEDFAGETATFKEVSNGWNPILSGLKTLLETGEPLFDFSK